VHSGQAIRAKIKRMRVWRNVAFHVFQKRRIRYENREVWNMWKPEEVWEHFARQDERVLPLEYYEVIDKRRWEPHGRIEFRLKEGEVPDTTENGCGSAGRDGSDWNWPRVDPVPAGREHGKVLAAIGGRTGPLDGDSSGTDSVEGRTTIIIIHLLGLAPAGSWLHRTTARRAA
jgi:hypothetical protein